MPEVIQCSWSQMKLILEVVAGVVAVGWVAAIAWIFWFAYQDWKSE